MLERPDLSDSMLVRALRAGFGLPIDDLAFEPQGNDSAAWTYRARSAEGVSWFVKVRRVIRPAGVVVPQFLRAHGLAEVLAPLSTAGGDPWLEIGPWSVLVYPFIDAPSAMATGMTEDGWRRLGTFAARLHGTVLPDDVAAVVPREDFRPKATALAQRVGRHVTGQRGPESERDEIAARLAAAWSVRRGVIERLVEVSEELAGRIRRRAARTPLPFALCHADFHAANVLVGLDGDLTVVDWDEVVLAPPERDLMFVRGSAVAGSVTDREATAFEAGYGSAAADPLLIAWYRTDWAVQDLADFARRAALDPTVGVATRARALALFESVFDPDGEADGAFLAMDRLAAVEGP